MLKEQTIMRLIYSIVKKKFALLQKSHAKRIALLALDRRVKSRILAQLIELCKEAITKKLYQKVKRRS